MEIIFGVISGIIASWGMGGGVFLISSLSNFLGIEQHIAQATNLLFFVPSSLCSVIVNSKNKNVKYKLALSIVIFGIIGAIFGGILSNKLDKTYLKKAFGVLLLCMAVAELYNLYKMYIKNKKRHNNK